MPDQVVCSFGILKRAAAKVTVSLYKTCVSYAVLLPHPAFTATDECGTAFLLGASGGRNHTACTKVDLGSDCNTDSQTW